MSAPLLSPASRPRAGQRAAQAFADRCGRSPRWIASAPGRVNLIGEIDRTIEAGHRIRARHWERLGELMYASHRSLRDDYEVSCVELDAVTTIAEQIGVNGGVYGCRMTGAGFGGCCVALVHATAVEPVSTTLANEYHKRTGIAATVFSSRPAAGATIIETTQEN